MSKLLDSHKPRKYKYSVDVLNKCFGPKMLGKIYKAWMYGSCPFESNGVKYSVWFPKLSVNGMAASTSGWINTISPDGKIIEEYGGKKRFNPSDMLVFVFAKNGSEPYYFRGVFKADTERSTSDYHYYYKVADIADLRGSSIIIHYLDDEDTADTDLISDLQKNDIPVSEDGFEYKGVPQPVPEAQQVNGRLVYPRNRQTAINALIHAGYVCEIDSLHHTFIRKRSGKPYTEPHHLIPVAQQDRFSVSLDVEENIVSLCSTCHKHIHYGIGADKLIKKLYQERKEALRSAGIKVTEKELLSFYGYKK